MFSYLRNGMAFATMMFALGANPALNAQEQSAKVIETGTFHGKVHNTGGGINAGRGRKRTQANRNTQSADSD